MNSITLPIPPLKRGQHVEIEVTTGGTPRRYEYRVEMLEWNEDAGSDPIDDLKTFISEQGEDWQLVQIGLPKDGLMPVTFRKRPLRQPKSGA